MFHSSTHLAFYISSFFHWSIKTFYLLACWNPALLLSPELINNFLLFKVWKPELFTWKNIWWVWWMVWVFSNPKCFKTFLTLPALWSGALSCKKRTFFFCCLLQVFFQCRLQLALQVSVRFGMNCLTIPKTNFFIPRHMTIPTNLLVLNFISRRKPVPPQHELLFDLWIISGISRVWQVEHVP